MLILKSAVIGLVVNIFTTRPITADFKILIYIYFKILKNLILYYSIKITLKLHYFTLKNLILYYSIKLHFLILTESLFSLNQLFIFERALFARTDSW